MPNAAKIACFIALCALMPSASAATPQEDYMNLITEYVHRMNNIYDGTWAYTSGPGTLSMTSAGTASLFVAEDYLYGARFGVRVGREPFSPPLKRALDWWERGGDINVGVAAWWGYTLYGIERVGLASGFKYFGKHDWYRVLAARAA